MRNLWPPCTITYSLRIINVSSDLMDLNNVGMMWESFHSLSFYGLEINSDLHNLHFCLCWTVSLRCSISFSQYITVDMRDEHVGSLDHKIVHDKVNF